MRATAHNIADATLLIAEDDEFFRTRLATAMEQRGFSVQTVGSVREGLECLCERSPAYAILDLRLNDGSGLDIMAKLHAARPDSRAIVLTGYGNFATAVSAVKLGAVDYIAKPADADEIADALLAPSGELPPPPEQPASGNDVRLDHIMRIYRGCDGNVSKTARQLNMHRRTLQRILTRNSVKM